MNEQRKIAALSIDGNGPNYFYESELLNIETWKPKSNYTIPIFMTLSGAYTVPTTLNESSVVFRSFVSLDGPALVNMSNVDSYNKGDFGGIAYFKDSSVSTGINKKKTKILDRVMSSHTAGEKNLFVLSEEILEDGKLSSGLLLPENEILLLDLWEPKSNYKVPRLRTRTSLYTVATTLGACKEVFSYLFPAHSGSLINLDLVEDIDKEIFGYKVRYKETSYRSDISAPKAKMLKKILKNNYRL